MGGEKVSIERCDECGKQVDTDFFHMYPHPIDESIFYCESCWARINGEFAEETPAWDMKESDYL